jgi:hypothetical protein
MITFKNLDYKNFSGIILLPFTDIHLTYSVCSLHLKIYIVDCQTKGGCFIGMIFEDWIITKKALVNTSE